MPTAIEIPPLVGFNTRVFDLGHFQQLTPTGDVGFIQTINRTSPTWSAEYGTPGLTGERYNETRSFLDMLEGSMFTFLAYDPRRPMPYAYMNLPINANVWGVNPRITAQDYSNSTIDLDQMLAGAIISKSDYISVKVGPTWYLFRAQENRVVPGNGIVDNLLVKPRPNIAGLVATNIRYQKACIEMKMIGEPEENDSVDSLPNFKFRAAQFTNRAVPV